ncbi:MAG: hypothetical protein AAF497_10695 [Planctomycetota bacterium]
MVVRANKHVGISIETGVRQRVGSDGLRFGEKTNTDEETKEAGRHCLRRFWEWPVREIPEKPVLSKRDHPTHGKLLRRYQLVVLIIKTERRYPTVGNAKLRAGWQEGWLANRCSNLHLNIIQLEIDGVRAVIRYAVNCTFVVAERRAFV